MKRLQIVVVFLAALALGSAMTVQADQPGTIPGKATVRFVKGNVQYSVGGVPLPLKANMQLVAGATITTGPDSYADISVNDGMSALVRVSADTTLVLDKMDIIGAQREGDTETMLDLKAGTILGQVKKVSANSRFEIKTPHGVAGVRGTDWSVTVIQLPDGHNQVTFTSLEGTLVASAVVNGALQTETLTGGMSWTVGGPVVKAQIQLLQPQIDEINAMIAEIQGGITPGVTPIGPMKIRPIADYPGYVPGDILPIFPTVRPAQWAAQFRVQATAIAA